MRHIQPRCFRPKITQRTPSWSAWQQEIVELLDRELGPILGEVGIGDVDWQAWRPLYEEGRSAKAALDRAFERD